MNPWEFQPTHVAPPEGLATWAAPEPSQPTAALDPLLPVLVDERRGDWARVVCANGWTAWVDGRRLVTLPRSPAATSQPLTVTADPRPLLARLEQALAGYRELVDDLAAGRLDLQSFHRRAAGFRLGAVVDGTSAWLLDLERDCWYYCDGAALQPYATVEVPPGAAEPVAGEPGGTGEPSRGAGEPG
ncbi:hypothetical protein [Streptacidiphilus sp. EB129]|uniref:hypothetical protein n=1 Tax=Streptacidiphilus sp. EB129 TaxID=3156262 RepID=UPI0035178027